MKTSEYVIVPVFIEENHLVLMFDEVPLATVCEPSGPGGECYAVWTGDGLDEDGDEKMCVNRFFFNDFPNREAAWKAAVRYGYLIAASHWNFVI